jgi:uncharacterized protein (TIGR03437 family)
MLLAPGTAELVPWSAPVGETLTLTATVRFVAAPDPIEFAPYVDRYGQSRYGDWPQKVKSETELAPAAEFEEQKLTEWSVPSGYDTYGGITFAGWKEQLTGFYRVTKRNGVWWLITPDGNPCFYIGVTTAPALDWDRTPVTGRTWFFEELPPKTPPWSAAWGVNSWGQTDGTEDVAFHAVNMIRKYGPDWSAKANDLTARRLRAWGFSGLGKWSTDTGGLPIIPVLYFWDVPNVSRHPDIFDAAIRERLRASLGAQILPRKNDPLVVGWSVHNEYDDIITPEEISEMLGKPSTVAAKRALVDEALASIYGGSVPAMASSWRVQAASVEGLYTAIPSPPAGDLETLRRFFARRYYGFLYQTIKELDPNHLYFGFWIVPNWWINEEDWRLIAPYCDVIGYDRYAFQFPDGLTDRLFRETDKPVLLGEFSFPSTYNMMRGFGAYPAVRARDDAAAGDLYRRYLEDARRDPYGIGVCWFQYRDQPVGGRGPGHGPALVYGENYAFGLVDVADRPKYDLVERIRSANLQAPLGRLAAPDVYSPPPAALNQGGAVNVASYASGAAVAPGSLLAIFGTGLASRTERAGASWPVFLGGAKLTLGGHLLPLYFVSPLQINGQVPWEAAGLGEAMLSIESDGLPGNSIQVKLAPFAPGIFSADMSGAGQGAILISLEGVPAAPAGSPFGGHPARRGDYISIYCTGLGPVTNQPPTGAPGPLDPLAWTIVQPVVTIGGVEAEVSYSGLAPGYVGLYQVNVKLPAGAPAGDTVPVVLRIGGVNSNTVTIALAD